jgi:hypothetical protein
VSNGDRDSEGFPLINDDTIGTLYTDEYGVTYVCEFIDDLGAFGWRAIGRRDDPGEE